VVEDKIAKEYYTDYEEMLDKADIDAVIITTPHATHAAMTVAALKAGKHALVEKPLASSFVEADRIVEESRKVNTKLMALPAPSPCMEAFNKVKELVDEGILGKVCFMKSRLSHGGPGHAKWYYQKGGGAAVDLGIYPLTKITSLLGPARKVQAFFGTAIPERICAGDKIKVEAEDNVLITLDFGGGVLASVEANYVTILEMEKGSHSEIYGTKGAVFLDRRDQNLSFYSGNELYAGLDGWIQKTFPAREYRVVDSFIESIVYDKKPPYTGEQQRHVVEILEGAQESARRGKSVNLTSSF
jgi:predicted dehydrogenase